MLHSWKSLSRLRLSLTQKFRRNEYMVIGMIVYCWRRWEGNKKFNTIVGKVRGTAKPYSEQLQQREQYCHQAFESRPSKFRNRLQALRTMNDTSHDTVCRRTQMVVLGPLLPHRQNHSTNLIGAGDGRAATDPSHATDCYSNDSSPNSGQTSASLLAAEQRTLGNDFVTVSMTAINNKECFRQESRSVYTTLATEIEGWKLGVDDEQKAIKAVWVVILE